MRANKENSNGAHFGGRTLIFLARTGLFASQSSLWLSKERAHSKSR